METYSLCLKAHAEKVWGERTIDSITSIEIRELIRDKVGSRSHNHQKNVLKYIRRAFNYAFEKGYIERNPTPLMKF